jgi:LPS-assembly lipoprotein
MSFPPSLNALHSRRAWLVSSAVLGLTACGFRLRGNVVLAFQTLRMTGSTSTPIARELSSALIGQGVRVDTPSDSVLAPNEIPQVVMNITQDQRQRVVVGQTSAGQVRELELRASFEFALSNAVGREVIPATALALTRSLNFSETAVLAKDAEEAQLFNDMQNDMVSQVMRRLSTVRAF